MKCKDCTMDCHYRTSDGEKECVFQNHIIQAPDEWKYVRIQAAIAAMQGFIQSKNTEFYSLEDVKKWQKVIIHNSIVMADVLIEELKKK